MSNYRLLYSASSNFKEVDIPNSMLINDICISIFLKFSLAFRMFVQ